MLLSDVSGNWNCRSILIKHGSIASHINSLTRVIVFIWGRKDGQTDMGEYIHTEVQTYCQPTASARLESL